MENLSSYKKLYLETESKHLESMQQYLTLLLQNAKNIQAVTEIYRHAHSLKSGSLLMGYKNVGTVAAVIEETFLNIQNKRAVITPDVISNVRLLFEKIKELLQQVEKESTDISIEETIGKLKNAVLESSGNNPVIYLVDDDSFFRKFYSTKLQELGYVVETAADGEECMGKMREKEPDLLLLDLIMPKKDGFEVLKEISQDERLNKIPVLVFSTLEQVNDMNEALKLGAKGHINKSVASFEEAKAKIISLLNK